MHDDSSEQGKQFFIPIIISIVASILGLISFHLVYPDYPFLRKLYLTFQLFTMESGDHFYNNGPQPATVTTVFNLARYLAVAALVITIVLAILSVLRYKYFLSKVHFMKDHTILCGLGELGEAMALNFRDKKKLVIIEKDTSNENLAGFRREGVTIIEANALDKTVMGRIGLEHASSLAAVTGDDFVNLTIVNTVLDLLKTQNPEDNGIKLTANIDSRNLKASITDEWKKERRQPETELRRLLRDYRESSVSVRSSGGFDNADNDLTRKYNMFRRNLLAYNPEGEDFKSCRGNIKLFNINQLAARYIFRNFPPDRFRRITGTDDRAMEILIIGFSKIGEELFKLCAQNCHYINRKKTRITLVSPGADEFMKRVNAIYKNLKDLVEIKAIKMNPHHLTGTILHNLALKDVDVIYVCSAEDHYQASYSSRARELYSEMNVPVIRPFYKNKTWNTSNPPENLFTFNILDKVAVLEDIIDECTDRKAIAVHHRWIRLAISGFIKDVEESITQGKDIPAVKPTLRPWHLLDEEIRDDNRSVVEHMNVKLRSVNQLSDPHFYNDPSKAAINYSFASDPVIKEQLAEMEHRRWMATKYLYGWDYGPERDLFLRKHESLKEFEQLDESIKDYDLKQIEDIEQIVNVI